MYFDLLYRTVGKNTTNFGGRMKQPTSQTFTQEGVQTNVTTAQRIYNFTYMYSLARKP